MTNLPQSSPPHCFIRVIGYTWLGIGVLWLVVQLPYPVIYRLGCGLGKLALRFMKRRAKILPSQPGTVLPGNERTRTP